MQNPQMPRIISAMRMKIATTPHVGMPVFSPITVAALIPASKPFCAIPCVGSGAASSSFVIYFIVDK